MMRLARQYRWIILVLLAVGVVLAVQWVRSPAYVYDGRVSYREAYAYWLEHIPAVGSREAQKELITVGNTLTAPEAHHLAHAFGSALFDVEGIAGLAACDDSFAYGCLHQFLGSAIFHRGIGVMGELIRECTDMNESDVARCVHGIGHGLVGYHGYTLPALEQSLELCDSIEISGANPCPSGAFMEFNMRTLMAAETETGITTRPVGDSGIFWPCIEVSSGRSDCITQLPYWWLYIQPDEMAVSERYKVAGDYCREFTHPSDRDDCFRGVGHTAAFGGDLEAQSMRRHCELAAQTPRDRLVCYSGIVWRFAAVRTPNAESMCHTFGIEGDALEYCVGYLGDRDGAVPEV